MRSTRTFSFVTGVLLAVVMATPAVAAQITVTLDTAGLPAGDYLFDFQFINGDNATGNNAATVSAFSSTDVTLGAFSLFGTATGADLVSGVTLADGPFTEVDQAFTATATPATVSFTLNYSANYALPGPGDAFTFAITDTSVNSTRSSGNGAELEIDLNGANPLVSIFPADPAFGGFEPDVASNVATSEPATLVLSGSGMFLLGLCAIWLRREQGTSSTAQSRPETSAHQTQ